MRRKHERGSNDQVDDDSMMEEREVRDDDDIPIAQREGKQGHLTLVPSSRRKCLTMGNGQDQHD